MLGVMVSNKQPWPRSTCVVPRSTLGERGTAGIGSVFHQFFSSYFVISIEISNLFKNIFIDFAPFFAEHSTELAHFYFQQQPQNLLNANPQHHAQHPRTAQQRPARLVGLRRRGRSRRQQPLRRRHRRPGRRKVRTSTTNGSKMCYCVESLCWSVRQVPEDDGEEMWQRSWKDGRDAARLRKVHGAQPTFWWYCKQWLCICSLLLGIAAMQQY